MFRGSPQTGRFRACLATALVVAASSLGAAGCGGGDKSKSGGDDLQTVTFQRPADPGPKPFSPPADVAGPVHVDLGDQPFGGSGSNQVCDRDKLIRFMRDHPDRMREWARVLDIAPTFGAVRRYIARLHPVTLTRDTQVTNHSFVNGRASPFQAILQAGTAVLVDKYGRPRVRCRCGNPLLEPVFVSQAKCRGCPPNYRPPRPCDYYRSSDNYDAGYYASKDYDNQEYDAVFVSKTRSSRFRRCYEAYPEPPSVTIVDIFPASAARAPPPPQTQTETTPTQTDPSQALDCNAPRSQLEFEQCRDQSHPDQQTEPETTTPAQGPECDVAHYRANGCSDIEDKSTDPGIQP